MDFFFYVRLNRILNVYMFNMICKFDLYMIISLNIFKYTICYYVIFIVYDLCYYDLILSSTQTSQNKLWEFFAIYGQVRYCQLLKDHNGKSKG